MTSKLFSSVYETDPGIKALKGIWDHETFDGRGADSSVLLLCQNEPLQTAVLLARYIEAYASTYNRHAAEEGAQELLVEIKEMQEDLNQIIQNPDTNLSIHAVIPTAE